MPRSLAARGIVSGASSFTLARLSQTAAADQGLRMRVSASGAGPAWRQLKRPQVSWIKEVR